MDEPSGIDRAEAYLLDWHRAHAGGTARVFARGRVAGGASSYDRLAAVATGAVAADTDGEPAQAPPQGPVVDLGCGDGFLLERLRACGVPASRLIGVDMSPDELALARARPALDGVALIHANARDTGLATASAACVVSHLAFMLMRPADAIVAEIARVLRPGGLFATVVGAGPRVARGEPDEPDAFALFLEMFVAMLRELDIETPRIGDRRTRSDDGLAALLCAQTGFAALAVEDFSVSLDGPIDVVWYAMSSIYESLSVPADAMAALRDRVADRLAPLAGPDGVIPCAMWMRLVTCRRREQPADSPGGA